MLNYYTADQYIETATSIQDRITKIDQIITALEDAALSSAANSGLSEYWLDTGQTKIKSAYRNVDEIIKSIRGFEQMKELYKAKLNGRTFRLVDLHSHTRQ